MKSTEIRLALAQINTTVGDLEGNRKKVIDYIKKARGYCADLVIFPELAICGYPPEDLLLKEYFVRDNLNELKSIVRESSGLIAIVGFVDKDKQSRIYNSAAIIQNGSLKGSYHKIILPNYGVFDEKRYFTHGTGNTVYKSGDILFGVSICEDIWFEDGPHRAQSRAGANLLINISASPYYTGKNTEREKMLSKRAVENKAYVCYLNLVGGQDELVFDGSSLVYNPKGKLIASGKRFEEDMLICDLKVDNARAQKAAKDVSTKVLKAPSHKNNMVPVPRSIAIKMKEIEEIYAALVMGTRDYIEKNGFKKAVIGLSGGIDSALTAVIACDAIGSENVTGISMPSRYSSGETQKDTRVLASNLAMRIITMPIDSIFNMYLLLLEKEFMGLERNLTEENIQARIRGNILMAFSNKFNWLVLITGNKSETSVGYCTLYGDMAGGFGVIKDIPKTVVYKLARYRNSLNKKPLIPDTIIEREPSAELRYGQMDKDSLPPYPVLDAILKAYVEDDRSYEEIADMGNKSDTVRKVIQKVDRNEFKRRQSAPGVKITPKAFGKDRRLPITNKYKEY